MSNEVLGGGTLGGTDDPNVVTGNSYIPSLTLGALANIPPAAVLTATFPPIVSFGQASAAVVPHGFRCPTLKESMLATLALLPLGRAWPANDGGTTLDRYLKWLAGLVAIPRRDAWPAGFVQTGFFAAIAAVRNFVERRLCDLRLEFWCATHKETHDLWMREYGLPDACDPFPDLCTKVAAIGGARCEYYAAIAARAGWSITCDDFRAECGGMAGCFVMNADQVGGLRVANRLVITVDLNDSTAYAGPKDSLPYTGCFMAGQLLSCEPDISPLKCILDRVVSAHVEIEYHQA